MQTRENALFLSVCGSYNGAISKEIISLFQKVQVSGLSRHLFFLPPGYPARYLGDDKISEKLLGLIRLADPGITQFRPRTEKVTRSESSIFAAERKKIEEERTTFEAVYGSDPNNTLQMEDLSAGTIKMILAAGDVLRAINNDRIVVIDEIDIRLHPLLIEAILESFHSHPTSKAQLIFTTHNTYPLRKKMLRRDQVWFVNKMPDFSSHLVNFAEFKVRHDAPSYEEDYMNGRFGGIPTMEIPEIFGEDDLFEEEVA